MKQMLNGGLDVWYCAPIWLWHNCRRGSDAHIGAGTVLSAAQNKAIQNGAKFLVSPGLDDGVVNLHEAGLTVLPTGELQRAWNMGLRIVKFFQALPVARKC